MTTVGMYILGILFVFIINEYQDNKSDIKYGTPWNIIASLIWPITVILSFVRWLKCNNTRNKTEDKITY